MKVLVTGATGYVGGRLVPELLQAGHEVRVLVRDPRRVEGRPWLADAEVVAADLGDRVALGAAARGVEAAYYLIHSMAAGAGYAARDRALATAFADALQTVDSGVGRITPSMDEAGRSFGYQPLTMLRKVHIPMLQGSLLTARTGLTAGPEDSLPARFIATPSHHGWRNLTTKISQTNTSRVNGTHFCPLRNTLKAGRMILLMRTGLAERIVRCSRIT